MTGTRWVEPGQGANRYFVVEHETGIVRAAQSTLRGALEFSDPSRIIYGPMSVEQFHVLTSSDVRNIPFCWSRRRLSA